MTILPPESNFLSGLASGASEGILNKVQSDLLKKQWNVFLDAYQARQQSGATQTNSMAVFGEPGQTMAGGMGTSQPQQNTIMQRLTQMLGGMGRGIGGGLQGLGQGIGNIGQGLGGILGLNRPQLTTAAPIMRTGNPQMTQGGQMGPMNPNYTDPRIMMILQQLLGGRMGMF